MANILPFKAIRPKKELASKIAALPYDVYSRIEAKEVVENNPYSFLKIDRAETQFNEDVNTYADCVYQKAKEIFWEMVENKSFEWDTKPFYYIYELTMDGRTQTGLVAVASIDDYCNNIIKKHENTRADKEIDRIKHVSALEAQTGPIFLAYRKNESISSIISKKKQENTLYDFLADDKIRHRVWILDEPNYIQSITKAFASMQSMYIADGHHRCASAVKVGLQLRKDNPSYTGSEEFNYFLSVLFPENELKILDYNRVVKTLNGHTIKQYLQAINTCFTVELSDKKPHQPQQKGQISMYLENTWYTLTIKNEYITNDPVEGLDVSYLQRLLLDPILGIKDPTIDKNIDFVGGIRGLQELERRVQTDSAVAFAMYPTSILELFTVADAGELMPPKSTWFEPKLRSGLFIHCIK